MSTPAPIHAGVRVRDVSHAYRRRVPVLHGVSLDVPPGTIHCLLGESGCGKTTLLRLIAGLERQQSGEIWIGPARVGCARQSLPPEKRSIGFVFQDYALFPHLSARQNVMFGMTSPRAARPAEADQWLARVGLTGFESAMPHTLSGGQQQRVAVARALARRPAVMLLDEPFSGLDSGLRQQVRDVTVAVLREQQIATLMVTHDPQEAALVGDAVSVIRRGEIVREADADLAGPA
jgi:iron(III) transport system ATP-binding protein